MTEVRLTEEEIETMEAFAAEHGIAAMLDHLGLNGLGNEVNDLRRVAKAAERHAFMRDSNDLCGPELYPEWVEPCPICEALRQMKERVRV